METYSQTLTPQQIEQLKKKYFSYISNRQLPHVNFQIKLSDCTITVYHSNKVVYQGENLSLYIPSDVEEQAGSDEVGTGDYFGPVVVCACFVKKEDADFLKQHHVTDSKQLSDDNIREHAPALMKRLTYSLLILDNVRYNQVHHSNNMNAIKAKLHNQAYLHLKNKVGKLPSLCVVDQFTPESLYYRYLANEPKIVRALHFETKAESKYCAVAAASMIARYAFLKYFDAMEKKYDTVIPKGAGNNVDEFAKKFVEKYGFEELGKIAKLHFKNTEKVKS